MGGWRVGGALGGVWWPVDNSGFVRRKCQTVAVAWIPGGRRPSWVVWGVVVVGAGSGGSVRPGTPTTIMCLRAKSEGKCTLTPYRGLHMIVSPNHTEPPDPAVALSGVRVVFVGR